MPTGPKCPRPNCTNHAGDWMLCTDLPCASHDKSRSELDQLKHRKYLSQKHNRNEEVGAEVVSIMYNSFDRQVRNLLVGHHATKALKLKPETTLAEIKTELPNWIQALRENVRTAVRRAKDHHGEAADYSIEISDLTFTTAYNGFIFAVVTRTK